MIRIGLQILIIFVLIVSTAQFVTAQFNIKIPKIGKPKAEQPQPEPPQTNSEQPTRQTDRLDDPEPNDTPRLLLETLEIKAKNETNYWKTPNKNNVANWFPQVSFDVFYKRGSPALRFNAEWFNPDGSAWFSEPLEKVGSDFTLRSPYESKQYYENSIITTGTYGLKITDTKTGKVHFQGKFKVNKMAVKEDIKQIFYVDNDWMLPFGYVGFEKGYTDYEVSTRPMAFFWFKGNLESSKFEAELYFNNQKIQTTDKGGYVNKHAERGEHCYLAREVCAYGLYAFYWKDFLIDNAPAARQNNPNGYFTKDKPGEYVIKVYYNGEPVRETMFTIDQKGWIARNKFSEQIFLNNHRVIIPVKVIGNIEKWNATTWKSEAFYGNPLTGFNVP
jgi:hypothetical protein